MSARPLRTAVALCIAAGIQTAAAQVPAQATDTALYRQNCATCHGATGVPSQGMMRMFRALAPFDSAFFAGRSEDSLVAVIRNGIGQMKGYSERLTPEQMTALARYLRTLPTARPATTP